MNRFNRPRLVTFDDPAYQRHVAEMKLQRANQRAIKPPSQRDLFGGQVETIVRNAVAQRFTLSDRRILEYEERKGRNWQRKYRELDVVVVEGQSRIQVFEIKASRRTGALHRALRQLTETQAILKLAFQQVSLAVIMVDTGMITAVERDALAATEDAPQRLPQTLDEAIAEHPQVQLVPSLQSFSAFPATIELAVLSLDELVALADGAPLSLNWGADEMDDGREEPPPPTEPFYSSASDQDEESPFAAALRKAAGRSKR